MDTKPLALMYQSVGFFFVSVAPPVAVGAIAIHESTWALRMHLVSTDITVEISTEPAASWRSRWSQVPRKGETGAVAAPSTAGTSRTSSPAAAAAAGPTEAAAVGLEEVRLGSRREGGERAGAPEGSRTPLRFQWRRREALGTGRAHGDGDGTLTEGRLLVGSCLHLAPPLLRWLLLHAPDGEGR